MILRPYQREASDIATGELLAGRNPLIVIPTGGGKSLAIAKTAADLHEQFGGGRVHIYAHTKELVRQNFATFLRHRPDLSRHAGIVCAGLGRRDLHSRIIFAAPGSMIRQHVPAPHRVLIDEAHRVGMLRKTTYRALIERYGVPVAGYTATPWRLGEVFSDQGLFGEPSFSIGMAELIEGGWIVPPEGLHARFQFDTTNVKVERGEFRSKELSRVVDTPEFNRLVAAEIARVWGAKGCKKGLLFATSVEHGKHLCAALEQLGFLADCVFGEDDNVERDRTLERFAAGQLDILINMGVLTTGFDETAIDLVVLARPTASVTLYVQMAGRGCRLHPGKHRYVLLDFGGNIKRHGPVDQPVTPKPKGEGDVPPLKECGNCKCLVLASARTCTTVWGHPPGSGCGFVFPPAEKPLPTDLTAAEEIPALYAAAHAQRWVKVMGRPSWLKSTFGDGASKGYTVIIPTAEGNIRQHITVQSSRPMGDKAREANSRKWRLLAPGAPEPTDDTLLRLHEIAAKHGYPGEILINRNSRGFFDLHDAR